MILLRQLAVARGPRTLFSGASMTLERGWKVGLIGANGCGKSSLMAVLAGELSPDAGALEIQPGTRMARIEQEAPALDTPVIEYLLDADLDLRAAQVAVHHAESNNDGHAIALAHEHLEQVGGYTAHARAAALLAGLGFPVEAGARAVREFSGGYRMRLNLARALMCPSNLLLLDEPTNHLDIDTVLWLETWLRSYEGTLIVVSHDRDFLDRVADHIVAVLPAGEVGAVRLYTGNYSAYETLRAAELVSQHAMAARQEREIQRLSNFVARFKAKASKARQAQSRVKQLERMTRVAPVYAANSFQFQFEPPLRDPERIVSLEEVQLAYDQRTVLNQVSLTLSRGDRLAVIGVNGAGKTTLVKMLAGELAPSAGRRSAGREIVVGYFAQHQIETLPAEATPLKLFTRHFPQEREQALRDFLGRFGFHGEAAERPIGPLSGGEKSRLALAVLVRQRPNLLLLDEPTNHLDLEMRRSLAMALQGYEGALVIVSHDRHLLATCADRILVVESGQVREFDGDLEDYRKARLKEERAQRADSPRGTRKDLRRESAEQRAALTRQLKPLEKAVASAETLIAQRQNDLANVRAALADNALYSEENKVRLKQTLAQEARIQSELAHAEEDWLHASARLDAARDVLTKSDTTAD